MPIKVVVHGASGKVGKIMVDALSREPGLKLVGAVDAVVSSNSILLPDGSGSIPFSSDLASILHEVNPDVMVDFSTAKATIPAIRIATKHKVNLVVGTTGLNQDNLNEIDKLAKENSVGAVVASNFALGAVLMIHLAKIASKYLDYAEIIELHHNLKTDAPSGTAISTAKAMAVAKGNAFKRPPVEQGENPASRGNNIEGISVHSVRLPGFMAHQEVIFGGAGQTLSIRHDTINRECYVPGVALAVKEVVNRKGLIYGLDVLLGLS